MLSKAISGSILTCSRHSRLLFRILVYLESRKNYAILQIITSESRKVQNQRVSCFIFQRITEVNVEFLQYLDPVSRARHSNNTHLHLQTLALPWMAVTSKQILKKLEILTSDEGANHRQQLSDVDEFSANLNMIKDKIGQVLVLQQERWTRRSKPKNRIEETGRKPRGTHCKVSC